MPPLDSSFLAALLTILLSAVAYVVNSEYRSRWLTQTVNRHEEQIALLQAEQSAQAESLSAIGATLELLRSAVERIDAKLDRLSERAGAR